MIKLATSLCFALLITGCAIGYPGLRLSNSDGLNRLVIGMSRSEVIATMGTKGFGEFDNPARREAFQLGDREYEVS